MGESRAAAVEEKIDLIVHFHGDIAGARGN
jgi:hypothetical protein